MSPGRCRACFGAVVPQTDTPAHLRRPCRRDDPVRRGRLLRSAGFPRAPLSDLTISLHFDALGIQPTGHPGARAATSSRPATRSPPQRQRPTTMLEHWYFIAAVEVQGPQRQGAMVALGDSITDGRGSVPNANNRWPDDLARRLSAAPATRGVGVLNMGHRRQPGFCSTGSSERAGAVRTTDVLSPGRRALADPARRHQRPGHADARGARDAGRACGAGGAPARGLCRRSCSGRTIMASR